MKKKCTSVVYLLVCNIIFLSCDKNELPKFNELNSLRVIALTTPTPEASPSDAVTLTPVISDIHSTAALAALSDTVQTCIDIGVAYGVTPSCENNPTKVVVHTNRILTLPGLGSQWTGNADSFTVNVPNALIIFTGRSGSEQFNGVNYLVEYILKNSNGIEVRSFRRIVISNKVPKNTNPVITDILADGLSMTALPIGSVVQLSTDLSLTSAENYPVRDLSQQTTTVNELLSVTWMITDGKTKYFRSDVDQSNEYTGPEAAPTGRSAYIFAVARDQRGGVTVIKKQF